MTSVSAEVTNNATYTAQYKASQPRATGSAQQLTSNDFLELMMQQLQYQDPLKPTDNTEFIAQQAQFTQVSATQEMNERMTENNAIMQTLALVGKKVELTDPTNSKNTITGIVSQAQFTSDGANIIVNGKSYPISLVKTVQDPSTATSTTSTTSTTDTTNNTEKKS